MYHCDILGSNELQQGTAAQHYQCSLLQADGEQHLELNVNPGDGADLFAETPGVALSSESRPHSREWDGRDSGLVISDISTPGDTITFGVGTVVAAQTASGQASPNLTIPDNRPAGVSSAINISKAGSVSNIKVSVSIKHPYVGDLRVTLRSPGGKLDTLHAQLGGSNDDLVATYDSASPGLLSGMLGQSMQGDWVLNVSDRAPRDVGKLKNWKIELKSAPVGVALPSAAKPVRTKNSKEKIAARSVKGLKRSKRKRASAATRVVKVPKRRVSRAQLIKSTIPARRSGRQRPSSFAPTCRSGFTLHIYAALAEQERRMISQRTIVGLQAAKARGKKLGNPTLKAKPGTTLAENNRALAAARDEALRETLAPMAGQSSRAIVKALTELGITPPRDGNRRTQTVLRMMSRLGLKD